MLIERFFGKGRPGQSDAPAQQIPPQGRPGPAHISRDVPAKGARPRATGSGISASTATPPTARVSEPTFEEIAARAYDLWIARGRPEGRDHENWVDAEGQLRAERAPA